MESVIDFFRAKTKEELNKERVFLHADMLPLSQYKYSRHKNVQEILTAYEKAIKTIEILILEKEEKQIDQPTYH